MLNQDSIKTRQELAILQNRLLLLFLKYRLSFRCSEEAITEVPEFWREQKNLLTHCLLHAVFGNSTQQDPQVMIELKKSKDHHLIEICSSGNANTFRQAIVDYCEERMLTDYFKYSTFEQEYPLAFEDAIEVEHDSFSDGCRIRLPLHKSGGRKSTAKLNKDTSTAIIQNTHCYTA